MSRWRGALWARQTPAVESCSFAGSRPALDTGRWWNLVDTPRSERDASCMGVRVSPGPPDYTPVAESVDAARSKRASTCRFDSCREYQRTRPDGDGSSLQNCDSRFNSSRVCHVRDAEVGEAAVCKTVLTGFESRLSLQSEGAKRRQRFLVPKTSAPGMTRMGVRLLRPPPQH